MARQNLVRVGDPDGHGRYGHIDEIDDRLLCHECGATYLHLGTHAVGAHGLSAEQYRIAHGLALTEPLVAPSVRTKMSIAWERHRDTHLAALDGARDPDRARKHVRAQHEWTPATRVKRARMLADRRGRLLTAEEMARLGDDLPMQEWCDRVRTVLAADPTLTQSSISRSFDRTPSWAQLRLRRHPPAAVRFLSLSEVRDYLSVSKSRITSMSLPEPDALIGLGGKGQRQRRCWLRSTIDAWIDGQVHDRPCRRYLSASDMMRAIGKAPSSASSYDLPPADALTRETDGWSQETADAWRARSPRPATTRRQRQAPAAIAPVSADVRRAAAAQRRRLSRLAKVDEAARGAGYHDLSELVKAARRGGHGQKWMAKQLHIPRTTLRGWLEAEGIELPGARPQVAGNSTLSGRRGAAGEKNDRWGPIDDQPEAIEPGRDHHKHQ